MMGFGQVLAKAKGRRFGGAKTAVLMGTAIIILVCCSLLYSHAKGEYEFKRVENLLHKEYPEFSLSDDSRRIQILREFTFRNIPFARDAESKLKFIEVCGLTLDTKLQVARCFALSENGRGGGYCGLMGAVLARLYTVYGYESSPLNVGFSRINSHVLVLVKNPKDEKWYIEDPTFNQEYCRTDGSPMPADEALQYLRGQRGSEVRIVTGKTTIKCGVSKKEPHGSFYPTISWEERGGVYMSMMDSNRKYYAMDRDMEKSIAEHGFPADIKYSILFPVEQGIYSRIGIEK